jgi:hypothetical protein
LKIQTKHLNFLCFVELKLEILYYLPGQALLSAMSILFDCSTDNVDLHLKNIFSSNELDANSTTVAQTEGDRKVNRTMSFYHCQELSQ